MPLPKPRKTEKQENFMSRCMTDENAKDEFPKHTQRFAYCINTWKDRDKKSIDEENEENKEEDEMRDNIEYKEFSFELIEIKKNDDEEGNYGFIKGYAATFNNVDRGRDKIVPGAFTSTIEDFKKKKRQVRMYFNHDPNQIIGGFDPNKMQEDKKGLYVEGNINLDVQKGRDIYALMKQGVITDFSIGYTINDAKYLEDKEGLPIRKLLDLNLWEISPVTEPMNERAKITDVKSVTPFQDLPLAPDDTSWDSNAAIKNIRKFTGSEDSPSSEYKKAFFWYDRENSDNFTSYKLPYADIIDGRLKAVPRGIFAVAAVLEGARGGTDIPESDQNSIKRNVSKYYKKMGKEDPFGKDKIISFECMKDIELFLKSFGLSSTDRKILISKIKEFSLRRDVDNDDSEEYEDNENNYLRDVDKLNIKLSMSLIDDKLKDILKEIKEED